MSFDFKTPDLCDRHGDRVQVVLPIFRHFGGRRRFCGPMVTVRCPADNSMVRRCIDEPGDGRVLVVDGGAWQGHALLGGRLAMKAAAAIRFLASDAAAYITGQVIRIDGGFTAAGLQSRV